MSTYIPPAYRAPFPLYTGHLQTIFPALARNPKLPAKFVRERIGTPDDDFLDLDWLRGGHENIVIISHGLEGDSQRPYVRGMARALYQHGFDVLAWNFRGCSGEMNLKPRMYHSGATEDLLTVVLRAQKDYNQINLIGFSLGGNLTLKFLGEQNSNSLLRKAIVFSTPLDLRSGAINLTARKNILYEKRFLKSLFKKVRLKHEQFPELIDLSHIPKIDHVYDFDDRYTGPIHGFDGAEDYYQKCSSRYFLDQIRIPTMIVNAENDSFLTPEILDPGLASGNHLINYLITRTGGHCGFPRYSDIYWSEKVAIDFLSME